MEAVIDLGEPTEISSVSIRDCAMPIHWLFGARRVAVSVSDDGKTFGQVAEGKYPQMESGAADGVSEHELSFAPVKTRYVKVLAEREKSIPAWHPGAGKEGWLFVDEISVN